MTHPGEKIRKLRKQKKWTIEELGRRANIDRSAMTNIENGAPLGEIRARRIASALDVEIGEIWSPREDVASRRHLDLRLRSLEVEHASLERSHGSVLEILRRVLAALEEHDIQVPLDPADAESLAIGRRDVP